MEVENAEEDFSLSPKRMMSVRRTIRDKFVLYNSYNNMTPMTAGSNLKLPASVNREQRDVRSRGVAHSFSSRHERKNTRRKRSEVTEEGSPTNKSIIFTEENFRKNSRLIALKKESFLQTAHHNRQYIKFQFAKSGGKLPPEKHLLAEVVERVAD